MHYSMADYENAIQKQLTHLSKSVYDLDKCNNCNKKTITNGCSGCVIRKITDSIQALNILIVTRDMYPRRLFILNTKYKDILEKHSLLHLLTEDEYVWTPHLENDYAGIFVKDKFISLEWEDWLR